MTLITTDSPFLADLDYDNLDVKQQLKIQAIIEAHSEIIEKYCGRTFLADDFEEIHSGDGSRGIFVRNLPLNSLDSITYLAADSDNNVEYAAERFRYNSATGEIQWLCGDEFLTDNYSGAFQSGYENYQINYNGGFSEVPKAIQMMCADLVTNTYSPQVSQDNIESEKLGQYSYKLATKVFQTNLFNNTQILNLYKIIGYVS